ncbi:tyrosine-type recombinase/integrase [Tepidamorphus sp. 3E244]|uniref:tyrosine-type recombinase/integrase n=1 Tax=Tepidamorphus sp. 3E244 TaxID=3385498 RepID=UPI0038FD2FF6
MNSTNKLSDARLRSLKPGASIRKLSDGGGLQFWMMPSGSRLWRLAYRFGGKQKLMALGDYPAVTLSDARKRRDKARRLISEGIDPIEVRKAAKREAASVKLTFSDIAAEYLQKVEREGRSEATLVKLRWYVALASKKLGRLPLNQISPAIVLSALRPVEGRGNYETAQRMRSTISRIFRYAVATARAESDPAQPLQGALTTPKVTHRAAILNPIEFGGMLRAIDDYQGQPSTRIALKLMSYLFPRPGELRLARWSEFDLDAAIWTIPAERAKMRREHRKPLPAQAVRLLLELQDMTGFGALAFPATTSVKRSMSENTLNAALRRLGYTKDEVTAHGFRATASTLLNESTRWSRDAIERELGHIEGNDVRRAYARGEHLDERRAMIQWWADHCDTLRDGGEVVPFDRKSR